MDPLHQAQLDIAARLAADPYFAAIPVKVARKGMTDSDIETALSTLNEQSGKCGAVVVVLMPELAVRLADAPGPEYTEQFSVQVIETPLFNYGATGTGESAEAIARRVRQLLHFAALTAQSALTFTAMAPVDVQEGSVSYSVRFSRRSIDERDAKVPAPEIHLEGAELPVLVGISCADLAATTYYTRDGSYPSSANPAATPASVPFLVDEACTLRAVSYRTGYQASNVSTIQVPTA